MAKDKDKDKKKPSSGSIWGALTDCFDSSSDSGSSGGGCDGGGCD